MLKMADQGRSDFCIVFFTMSLCTLEFRVSGDLENLEMSGHFDARRKSQGKFCCKKFIFS